MYQQTDKKPFSFGHDLVLFDGKSKRAQLVEDLKAEKRKNDGPRSQQLMSLKCKMILMVILSLHGRLCGILLRSRVASCRLSQEIYVGIKRVLLKNTQGLW